MSKQANSTYDWLHWWPLLSWTLTLRSCPFRLATRSKLYVLYSWMRLAFVAAKIWPPWLKAHCRQKADWTLNMNKLLSAHVFQHSKAALWTRDSTAADLWCSKEELLHSQHSILVVQRTEYHSVTGRVPSHVNATSTLSSCNACLRVQSSKQWHC